MLLCVCALADGFDDVDEEDYDYSNVVLPEISLVLSLWTNHWSEAGTDTRYNNQTPGIGLTARKEGNELALLYLHNDSYGNPNLYIYGGKYWQVCKDVKFAMVVEFGRGYENPVGVPLSRY